MPQVRSATRPEVPVFDSWGNELRMDWRESSPGSGVWQIPGENYQPGEAILSPNDPALLSGFGGGSEVLAQALGTPGVKEGTRSFHWGSTNTPSVTAYNNSLRAQGIDPSELPYGQGGQIATARVLAAHGQPAPGYLKGYFASHQDQLFKALADEAARRGITVDELARQLGYM